jgi:hypothetical protein
MPRPRPKSPKKKATKKKATPKAASMVLTTERFDRSPYDVPVMELGEAIALATALVSAKPAKRTPAIDDELRRMTKARDRAKTVASGGDAGESEAKAYDVEMDRAWATFVRRIEDYANLPKSRHADTPEAATVYGIVKDLSILQLNYLAEFAQIGARLDDLKREGLLDAARTFAGTAFLDEVLHCHAEYGKVLGIMEPSVADRGEARNALAETIAEYVYQVMALARPGQPATWKVVEAALAPVVDLRAKQMHAMHTHPAPPPPAHPPVHA